VYPGEQFWCNDRWKNSLILAALSDMLDNGHAQKAPDWAQLD
jgi:hypothetical protein